MAIVKKKFIVEGMHCGSCAVSTGMILKNLKGVKSARADYEARSAEVELKPRQNFVVDFRAEAGGFSFH